MTDEEYDALVEEYKKALNDLVTGYMARDVELNDLLGAIESQSAHLCDLIGYPDEVRQAT